MSEAVAGGPNADERRLLDAMADELRLLGALRSTLTRLDEASSRCDADGIDEAVYAAHRLTHTLAEAQRRRTTLVEITRLRGGEATARAESVKVAAARLLACGRELDLEIRRRCASLEQRLTPAGCGCDDVTQAASL